VKIHVGIKSRRQKGTYNEARGFDEENINRNPQKSGEDIPKVRLCIARRHHSFVVMGCYHVSCVAATNCHCHHHKKRIGDGRPK